MRAAFLCSVLALPLLSLPALTANDLSPKDLDMVCAITSAAEMRANPDDSESQTAAATLWVFYLALLWQIYSRCFFAHIHLRQCGQR
jgi:hypothetical protein